MDLYAVFGNPIQHSLSPTIHQLFAAQTKHHLIYKAVLVPLKGFTAALEHFRAQGGKGLNVTSPFKLDAFQICKHLSEQAMKAGAVNTMTINRDGSYSGDNTDGIGLIRDLTLHLKIILQNKRILLLGAGGAARGIIGPLLAEDPQQIIIANRTIDNALTLTQSFADMGSLEACSLTNIPDHPFDIVINSISAGWQGETPTLNPNIIHRDTVCYDMIYSNTITPFLHWAKERGAVQLSNGLGMLVEQAAEAFYLWHKIMPETTTVIQQLRAL